MRALRVIIGGGYTGGHIHCALAIADALPAAAEILFVGADGGPEVAVVRAAGYPIETVWISALDRALTLRNLLLPLKLLVSHRQARRIVRRFAPTVVVGVGGYASAPIVAAAQRLGVPTVIHEANRLPGIANRLLARHADVICLGVEGAAATFSGRPTRVTGNPVRTGLAPPGRADSRRRLGLPPGIAARTLLVTGGSLGSRVLNDWVLGQQRRFAAHRLEVIWQSGRAHSGDCRARLAPDLGIHLVPYVDDMAAAYAAADLVIAGAGAVTLSELSVLGKPCIIVPAPDVTEDHQAKNAVALGDGVEVCPPDEMARLFDRVVALVGDEQALRGLATRMLSLARPDAAARIAGEILRLGGS